MTPDDRAHIRRLRAEFARDRAERDVDLELRRFLTPPDKLQANRERADARREADCEGRHAEYVARAAAIRDAAIEASERAYEAAERRRQERRIQAEALLMWEVAP